MCCLLVSLLLVPELLLEYARDPYVQPGIVRISFVAGVFSGLLLLGGIGMSLLTGEYRKHRKTFHRIWVVIAIFSVVSTYFGWINLIGVQ